MGGTKLGEITCTIMEDENLIAKNWLQQLKVFTENLIVCRNRPTREAVHDLRVSIKRMRSYLQLKQKLKDEEWEDQFTNTSALFKSLGKLRNFDMSLTLIRQSGYKELSNFISFTQYLSLNRNLARSLAKQEAIKYNEHELNSFDQQFRSLGIEMQDEKACEKIIQLSREKIKKIRSIDDQFEDNAHEIRKMLKIIYYWLKICPEDLADDAISLKGLDKVLNNLGKWQDYFILRKKINQFNKDQPVEKLEKEKLKQLMNELANEQAELLDKARKKWNDIVNEKGD